MQNNVKKIISEFCESILNFFFPTFCINCGKYGSIICDSCKRCFSPYGKQRCFVCDKFSKGGITHKKCKSSDSPDQLIVVNKYGKLEKEVIHRLKYRNGKNFVQIITEDVINKTKNHSFSNYVICPIPLHNKRLMIRGYNQVELIAKAMSEDLKLETRNLLIRVKNTKPQNKLKRKERIDNLKEAFSINNKGTIPEKVLLLDDLTTSGSTFREATKVLKENGVKKVLCLAFARGK